MGLRFRDVPAEAIDHESYEFRIMYFLIRDVF